MANLYSIVEVFEETFELTPFNFVTFVLRSEK